jgi:hypothetical protein
MSWWFQSLMVLVAVNVLAALVVRYPFSKRQIGFVVTHVAILTVLAGALVTKYVGVDGRVAIVEGQSVNDFRVGQEALTILNRTNDTRSVIDLDPDVFGGLTAVDRPKVPAANLDNLQVTIDRYLPDSQHLERVVNDNPSPQAAIEVSLSPSGREDSTWVFAGRNERFGPLAAGFRLVTDEKELARLLNPPPPEQSTSIGTVKIEFEGLTSEIPVEECMDRSVPIGGTSRTLRVLRYLPHASVGSDNKVTSISNQPLNPAIEVELGGPEGSEKRLAFAKFPDFQSMHGAQQDDKIKLTFIASATSAPELPLEVLGGPDGKLYARFAGEGSDVVSHKLVIGEPVDTPWAGRKFTVLRRFERARLEQVLEPVVPARDPRIPAVLLRLSMAGSSDTKWIQKFSPWSATIADTRYELVYGDKTVPLGFTLKLDRFEVGYYPGTTRPRSFESHVTITDPVTGRRQSRVISMNNPTDYGGFAMFQSSYRPAGKRMMSVLSVARDPGQMIVFTGYIGTMTGMLIVLGTRIADRRRMARDPATSSPQDRRGASRVEASTASADATADRREGPHAGVPGEDEQQQESGKREHP